MKRFLVLSMLALVATNAAEQPNEGRRLDYRVLVTGGELLSGVYPDAHTHFLTRTLHPLGARCVGSMTVDDVRERMLEALRFAANDVDLVIVTGGLGPTPNDITRETLAEFTGIPLGENPDVVAGMERRLNRPREQLPANLLRQAQVPARGRYLNSVNGTAAGLVFETDSVVVVALPGPPRELRAMVTNELLPYLRQRFGVRQLGASLTLRFVGIGQSRVSQTLKDHVEVPADVVITSLFESGRVDFTFSLPSDTPASEAKLARMKKQISDQLGEYLYADDGSSLEESVVRKLTAAGGKLAIVEVCTGGQLEAQINNITGFSEVSGGAYAAPTEEILAQQLDARSDQWSEPTASAERSQALAVAAAQQTKSTWALAVGQAQEGEGRTWVWAALRFPDNHVVTKRLAARGSGDDARAHLVTQLLDFLRRQLTVQDR